MSPCRLMARGFRTWQLSSTTVCLAAECKIFCHWTTVGDVLIPSASGLSVHPSCALHASDQNRNSNNKAVLRRSNRSIRCCSTLHKGSRHGDNLKSIIFITEVILKDRDCADEKRGSVTILLFTLIVYAALLLREIALDFSGCLSTMYYYPSI